MGTLTESSESSHRCDVQCTDPSAPMLSAVTLRRLYVDEQLTMAELAGRYACSASTVRRRLREWTIPPRPRGPKTSHRGVHGAEGEIPWSAEVAWIVGLMASDGNLARAGHALSLASNDVDLLESVRRIRRIGNRLGRVQGGLGHACYRLQWRDRGFHAWLTGIGLTPRKSLTLGPLAVPDQYFADFFRGCIDGDGTILVYTDRYHAKEEGDVRLSAPLRVDRCGEPPVRYLAARDDRQAHRRARRDLQQVGPGSPAHLDASVCETRVVAAAAVDVLRARDAVS